MFWVIAVIVIFVWVVVGGMGNSSGGATSGGTQGGSPIQGCQGCDTLNQWWASLNFAQKMHRLAWYLARKLHCKLSC
jgi:hypothetical protein